MTKSSRRLTVARALAISLLVSCLGLAMPGVVSGGAPTWTIEPTPNPGGSTRHHLMNSVAANSATDAWAVAQAGGGTGTIILHWDGAEWTQVASPSPGDSRLLIGVATTSASNAWAVGWVITGDGAKRTLILRWNGSTWVRVPSPNRGGPFIENQLNAVAATSANNAWAVGHSWDGTNKKTLTLHWNGTSWRIVPSPTPGDGYRGGELMAVSARSASDVWAVGDYYHDQDGILTLVLRWNGTAWKKIKSPNPGRGLGSNYLSGVAATSGSNAWAVGTYSNGSANRPLILRWNGTKWKKQTSPTPGGASNSHWLFGVAATSASDAWAVGWYWDGTKRRTLVDHWDGVGWTRMPSPNVGTSQNNELRGIDAVSATKALAVGVYQVPGDADHTLAMHCC